MNDIQMNELELRMRNELETIADRPPIGRIGDEQRRLRAIRRATAINAVTLARTHAGRESEPYSQSDADVIMTIMELLDRVAADVG